jgi:hypothetical protein
VAFTHRASQRIGTAIVAYCAAFALFAPSAGAQERSVVVAFVPDSAVLERTDLAVGRLIGRPMGVRPDTQTIPLAAPGQIVIAVGDRWIGMTGHGLLRSETTRRDGLVAGSDVARTIAALRASSPGPITSGGERDLASLRALDARFEAIADRRLPAAAALGVMLLALWRRRRTAALTALWAPATTLLTAALAPSLAVELLIIGPGSAALALLTERALPWPRAAAVPALAAVVAYCADVVLGSDLTIRSLLGPDPALGARFYGIGNELEAVLPALALIGVAALAPRRPAIAIGATMTALAAVVGPGRFGADVGGVITIAVAGAVAVAWPLRGRRVALLAAVPVVALATLAAIDLATGADSHFSRTVLDEPGTVPSVIGHRYELAWNALLGGVMPLLTVAAIAVAVWAMRQRAMLPPLWRAALAGALAGSVAGALVNDSGPLLFVLGVACLTAGTVYMRTGGTRTEALLPGP